MTLLSLDRSLNLPLTQQLYEQVRKQILEGTLPAGHKLTSSRELALHLGVSRNVVIDAFDQLAAEGYIESRRGSGTFVADGAMFSTPSFPDLPPIQPVGFKPIERDLIDFRSGVPDLNRFPISLWIRLTREVYQEATSEQLAYGSPEGRMELRRAIAEYVRVHRAVYCHPEQILITAGTTQAIGLVSRLLLEDSNKQVILEDPITNDIQLIVAGFGGKIQGVEVDDKGLKTNCLNGLKRPVFIYVTPSHQYPLGVTMPIQRRIQLLEYANRAGAFIVEDDYDSEFRYDGAPINAIQGLHPERVIYLGTFSKTLCPSLRIGYVIFPPELIEKGRQMKWFTDLHNATMDQLVLAKFLKQGHFARYVVNSRKIHQRKREALVYHLQKEFGDRVTILGSATGLHLVAIFRDLCFDQASLEGLKAHRIKLYPVEEHAIKPGRHKNAAIFGYGMLDEKQIKTGIQRLSNLI